MAVIGEISNELLENLSPKKRLMVRLEALVHRFFFLENGTKNGKFLPSGFANFPHGNKKMIDTQVMSGGVTAIRRFIFDEFTFDEKLTGYTAMEDQDFSRRVSRKYKCFYNPAAKCLHLHGEGGRGSVVEQKKRVMVNFRYFFFKNFYPHNKFYLLAHYWAILGLFVSAFLAIIFRPEVEIDSIKGYWKGLKEFSVRKYELLPELFKS